MVTTSERSVAQTRTLARGIAAMTVAVAATLLSRETPPLAIIAAAVVLAYAGFHLARRPPERRLLLAATGVSVAAGGLAVLFWSLYHPPLEMAGA